MNGRKFHLSNGIAATGMLIVSGCSSLPYGSTYEYQLHNENEIRDAAAYTAENAPFAMAASPVHLHLLSNKEQMSLLFDASNGFSGSMALSISENDALLFSGGTTRGGTSRHDSVHVVASYQVYGDDPSTGEVDGMYGYNRNNSVSTVYGEAAYGRFRKLGKLARHEFFLGAGLGETQNEYGLEADESYLNLSESPLLATYSDKRKHVTVFFQYGAGLISKVIEVAVAGRVCYYSFFSRTASLSNGDPIPAGSEYALSFHPTLRIAAGGRTFRAFFQYSGAMAVGNQEVTWTDPLMRLGVVFRINDAYPK